MNAHDKAREGSKMTFEETFGRVVLGHVGVIALCVLLPVLVTWRVQAAEPAQWQATVRIQVISTAPTSTTQAEGISSRVLALATTPRLLGGALRDARAREHVDNAVKHVTADRLGESPIVQLSVTDNRAGTAKAIVASLARRVTSFMNEGDRRVFDAVLAGVNQRVAAAEKGRERLTQELVATSGPMVRRGLRIDIEAAVQKLSQLSSERAALVLSDATRDRVAVIDGASPHVAKVPSGLFPRVSLALLLGLALGLTVAAGIETVRPRLADTRALARTLQAPMLGTFHQRPNNLGSAMTLAARRRGVDTVVLIGTDDRNTEKAKRLVGTLRRAAPGSGRRADSSLHGAAPEKTIRPEAATGNSSKLTGTQLDVKSAEIEPFGSVRFTHLSNIRPQDEFTAGVVVVSSGPLLRRRLDDLDDLLKTVRWPLLGVLDASGARFGSTR